MGRQVYLRKVTEEERADVKRLAHARTVPTRTVERARVVQARVDGPSVEAIATRLGLVRATVYQCLHCFDACGLAGLEDEPRSGRPTTYTREQVGEIVATALTDPQRRGLLFTS